MIRAEEAQVRALVRLLQSGTLVINNPPAAGGGGGGVVQQGARDLSAEAWFVQGIDADGGAIQGQPIMVAGFSGGLAQILRLSSAEPPTGLGAVVRIAGRGQQAMASSIPVVIASDQSAVPIQTVNSMTWVSVKSAAPAANAVQADTGALAAGDYDFLIDLAVSDTVAVGKGLVMEHRNAANNATLFNLGGCTPNGGAITVLIRRYTLALNERIRIIAGTAAGAANSMYISAVGRRLHVSGAA